MLPDLNVLQWRPDIIYIEQVMFYRQYVHKGEFLQEAQSACTLLHVEIALPLINADSNFNANIVHDLQALHIKCTILSFNSNLLSSISIKKVPPIALH